MKIWKNILCFFGICKKEECCKPIEEVKEIVINPTKPEVAKPEEILYVETPKEEEIKLVEIPDDDSMKELRKLVNERKKEIKPKAQKPRLKQYKKGGNTWKNKKKEVK